MRASLHAVSLLTVVGALASCSDSDTGPSTGAGDAANTGGVSITGGAPSSGGAGGVPASGGTPASGGVVGSGGSVASGGSSAGGSGGAKTDSGAGGAPLSSVFSLCGVTGAKKDSCPGLEAYSACVAAACGSPFSTCFGPDNGKNDFTGGKCEAYAECAIASSDPCSNTCARGAECETCLAGLVTCVQSSTCKPPSCEDPGPGPADGGVPPITGTCADLTECCNAVADEAHRKSCTDTATAAQQRGGDADCAVIFTTYTAAGICK